MWHAEPGQQDVPDEVISLALVSLGAIRSSGGSHSMILTLTTWNLVHSETSASTPKTKTKKPRCNPEDTIKGVGAQNKASRSDPKINCPSPHTALKDQRPCASPHTEHCLIPVAAAGDCEHCNDCCGHTERGQQQLEYMA